MVYRSLSAPLSIQVEVTESCTHCCKHCYNSFRHCDLPFKRLNREQLGILVREIEKNKISRVTITGGEPLVCVDDVCWFADQLRKFPWVSVSLNSNLVLFNERIGKELQKVGIKGILTSIMADNPELHDKIAQQEGVWQKAVNGIQIAKKLEFRVIMNMVLTKWNFHRLYQTGKLARKLGVDKFGATRACTPTPLAKDFHKNLISIDELRESIAILYQLKEECGYEIDVFEHYPWCALGDVEKYKFLARRKCMAGVTCASIGSDGQMRPCSHSGKRYGSVFEDGIAEVWSRMTEWREQKFVGVCKSCKYLPQCTGGCAVDAENSGRWQDTHCLGEEGVRTLPQNKRVTARVLPDEIFFIPKSVGLRKEGFGGSMFNKSGNFVLLDDSSFEIVCNLQKRGCFSVQEVVQENSLDFEEVLLSVSDWYNKQLVKKGGDML